MTSPKESSSSAGLGGLLGEALAVVDLVKIPSSFPSTALNFSGDEEDAKIDRVFF